MTQADPLWERYELSVSEMLGAFDGHAEVLHNRKVEGKLSQTKRQVDVLVKGKIIDLDVTVVVECKRHQRATDIGVVDQFIGKVLDVGAERAVIYSYSGFTSAAVRRAQGALNPKVVAIALETPKVVEDLAGAPGYPADLLVQEEAPQWVEEMDEDSFRDFFRDGRWSKFWS